MTLIGSALILLLRLYRAAFSPLLTAVFGPWGFGCRFHPTCSEYAIGAVRTHGPLRGTLLALRRLARCHPWGGSGHDPVPERRKPELPHREPIAARSMTATRKSC